MRDRNARHRPDDSILDAIKRTLARKAGASAHEIRGLMYTHPDRDRARALLQQLVRTGEAIKATKLTSSAGRPQERYYASPEHAAAWGQIQPATRARQTTKAMQAQRETLKVRPVKEPKTPARAHKVVQLAPDAPADFSRAKVIRTETPRGRFEPDGPVPRIADSRDCRPWVLHAVGAA